jgi:aldehyde:ferredoxin oxidoreductase
MATGYTRIARINLSNGSIIVEDTPEWLVKAFIGGKGFVYGILGKELEPGIDALSPGNKIVIAAGALAGLAPASAKTIVGAKSPLSNVIHDTSVGEWFSYMLRGAGFDALIIEGEAKDPTYLWVHDGKVELRRGNEMWGLSTRDTVRRVRASTIPAASVMAIGPGGENMARIANIIVDGERAGGRGGLGAVFGSKKLKAVAAYGTPNIGIANKDEFIKYSLDVYKKFQSATETMETREFGTTNSLMYSGSLGVSPAFNYSKPLLEEEEAKKISGVAFKEREINFPGKPIKIIGALCPIKCSRWIPIPGADDVVKPEYENIGLLGAATGVFDPAIVLKAQRLANDLGIDSIGAGNAIAWSMELYEKGLLSKEETGGLDLRFGNGEALLTLIHDIAYREGFGKVLAEGSEKAAKMLGKGMEYAVHFKGLALPAWYPNGPLRGLVISYLTADVGGSHLRGWPKMHDPETPLKDTVESMIEDRDHKAAMDSLGLCIFNPYTWSDMAKLYTWATGRETREEDLRRVSERIEAIARIYHVLEGYVNEWEQIPWKMLNDPNGPKYTLHEVKDALRQYYRLRKWDEELGIPTKKLLIELGIEWMEPLRSRAEKIALEKRKN